MDPEMKKDEGYTVAYSTSDVSSYDAAQIPNEIQGYYTELDWQSGALDHHRSVYTLAPRQEIPPLQFYPSYAPVAHSDLYPGANIWHPSDSGIQLGGDAPISHHGLVVRREHSRNGSSSSQRPKRRRTQSVIQRRAANVRERRRMFQLNEAFDELRKKLPAFNYEKRLSRIETLRLAMTYISFMQEVTTGTDPKDVKLLAYHSENSNPPHDLSLQTNGCHSPIHHNGINGEIDQEQIGGNLRIAEVPLPPPIQLVELPMSAVHVEMLPSAPAQITLPVTNLEVLTDQQSDTADETTDIVENSCPET
ncbi:hypothetical protein SNE40_022617 [Patella caerulea]|uniref:BHLH domain-containing protein n=1 Tax=Patella caerulea TaxID=87958 RepID=A0AAN8G8K4_PATCE